MTTSVTTVLLDAEPAGSPYLGEAA